MSPIIRAATEADVPAIRDIYNYEILNGWATFDTEEKSLEDRLMWFRAVRDHRYAVIVADDGEEVLGWGCLRPHHERLAYRFTVDNSVFIHQDHRGRGVGNLILTRLVEIGRDNGFRSIIAGVSQDNPASDHLHQRHGFQLVGVEREVGYKFDRWIDVNRYQLML